MTRKFEIHRTRLRPLGSIRREWITLLESARSLATGSVRDGERCSPQQRLTDFAHLLREARHTDFPVQGVTPGLAAEAFLRLGRAFCEASLPELRACFAPALAASAEALDGLLHLQRCAEAEIGRRVLGERD